MALQQEIKKVQNRAARFVTSNYCFETESMTGILEKLKWESLKKKRRDSRLNLLYKGLKGAASIPTDDLISPIRCIRNHHSLTFQTPDTIRIRIVTGDKSNDIHSPGPVKREVSP